MADEAEHRRRMSSSRWPRSWSSTGPTSATPAGRRGASPPRPPRSRGPATLAVAVVAIVGWVGLNAVLRRAEIAPDPYPYPLLALIVSCGGLLLAAMILIAQRHEDELSTRRDQLTLEVAILGEQKSAKAIALLEELRRDAIQSSRTAATRSPRPSRSPPIRTSSSARSRRRTARIGMAPA